jgi:MFS family permease
MRLAPSSAARPFPRKVALLAALYFVEGLPHGFRVTALPVYLREHGLSLTTIGFASLLALPWLCKALWAPAVDRFGSARFGRRRSWIVPTQAGLALACAAAAVLRPEDRLWELAALVFMMNLFAATMDIAVDGLAVDVLERHELGYGNIAQVVGYKIGMLGGGGLLLWASDFIGWTGMFGAMAGLIAGVLLLTVLVREPEPTAVAREAAASRPVTLRAVFETALRALALRGGVWVLLFVASYKLGESMADAMFRPFLVDAGYSAGRIGLWIGTWGMLFSLAGSFVGGIVASRLPLLRAVGIAAAVRVIPLVGVWWLSVLPHPGEGAVVAVTAAEHFFGGALTTTLFAFMMSRVDKRIGATHYTVLATIEVLGKMLGAWTSGIVGDAFGYATVFGAAVVLSAAYLGLLPVVSRVVRRAEAAGTARAAR